MGIYDTYGSTQLKVGDSALTYYKIGDSVDIEDGIYVGWDGFVVIKDGVFIAECETITSTHGDVISSEKVLRTVGL